MQKRNPRRSRWAFILAACFSACAAAAAPPRNTITFENHSGEPALVHLIGPSEQRLEVGSAEKKTIHVTGGRYAIVTRYGSAPNRYRYEKGAPFKIEDGRRKFSQVTIPLDAPGTVAQPASKQEFEHGAVPTEPSQAERRASNEFRPMLQVSMNGEFRWDRTPQASRSKPGVASLGEDRGSPEFVGLTNVEDSWKLKAPKELRLVAFIRAFRASPGGMLSLLVNDHPVWNTSAEPPKGTMRGFGESDLRAEFMQTPVIDLKPYAKPGQPFLVTLKSRASGYAVNAFLVVGR